MRRVLVSTLVILVSFASLAGGQERVAAYESLDVPKTSHRVTFAKLPAKSGDRVDQTIDVNLRLESMTRKGDQQVDKSTTSMGRGQQRTVIVEEVADGRTLSARVRFARCDRVIDGEQNQLPVVGNTYLCRRLDDKTLKITRADGSFASPEEFGIVAECMDSLGRPNPLADFLAGKTVAVGDVLEVPREVGAALLGSNDSLGNVSKFALTLREVDPQGGIAQFAVAMETQGSDKTQLRLMVGGDLDVEVQSCRTRRLTIGGPLGMATTTGSYSTAETTYVRGKLQISMSADYN